jgi:hypothetical protein
MEGNASDAYSEDDDNDYEALHVMRDVDGGYVDAMNDLHEDIDYDTERALSGTFSGSSGNLDSDLFYDKVSHKMKSQSRERGSKFTPMSKISVCFDRVALPFLYSVIVIMWTKSRRCWFVIFVFVGCSLVEIWWRLLTIKVYTTMCLIPCR